MLTAILAETASSGSKSGFPPFETWHWPSQAAWLIITFAALLFVLWRFILPRIRDTLETRQNTILSGLEEAQKLADQSREAEIALDKRLSDARARARATATEAQDRLRQDLATETARVGEELDRRLGEAETRIAALRDRAMAQVEGIAAEAAGDIVAHLGGRADAQTLNRAVAAALGKGN